MIAYFLHVPQLFIKSKYAKKNFPVFHFSTINLPYINTAVERVIGRTTRSSNKDVNTPMGSPPPPPPMPKNVPTAEMKPKKKKNATVPDNNKKNKQLQIEISESDKASCNAFVHKQTARRGRPFMKD